MDNWIYYTLYTLTINLFNMFNNVIIEYYIDLYSYPYIVSVASFGIITIYNSVSSPSIYILLNNTSNNTSNNTVTTNTIGDVHIFTYMLLSLNGICVGFSNILFINAIHKYKSMISDLITIHKSEILFTTIANSILFSRTVNPFGIILIIILLISFNRSIPNHDIYSLININEDNVLDEPLMSEYIFHTMTPILCVFASSILNTLSNLICLHLIHTNIAISHILQYQYTSLALIYMLLHFYCFKSLKPVYNNIDNFSNEHCTNIIFVLTISPIITILYHSMLYITYLSYGNIGYLKGALLLNYLLYNNVNRLFHPPIDNTNNNNNNCIALSSITGILLIEYYSH